MGTPIRTFRVVPTPQCRSDRDLISPTRDLQNSHLPKRTGSDLEKDPMPPAKSSTGQRGRPATKTTKPAKSKATSSRAKEPESNENPFESPEEVEVVEVDDGDEEEEPEKSIPPKLLTRLLHEFFQQDSTRVSKDANAAIGKYVDTFVREAIARAAREREGGFLEVSSRHVPGS